MSYTFYDGSILVAQDALNSLSSVLKKAQEHASAASLTTARLYEDMLPLTFQVHMVTDTCQKLVARLSNREPATFENNLASWEDINARVAEAKAVVEKADKDLINSRIDEVVTVGLGPNKTVEMSGRNYVAGYVVPNIFFHLATAYAILRKEGVPVGKMDYLGSFIGKYIPQ